MSDEYFLVDDDVLDDLRRRSRQAEQQRARADQALHAAQERVNEVNEAVRVRIEDDRLQLQLALLLAESKLSEDNEQLRASLDRAIEQQNRELAGQLGAIRASLKQTNRAVEAAEKQVQALTERFDAEFQAIAQRLSQQKDRAQCYQSQLDALLEGIDRLYPKQLTPGRAEALHDSRRFIDADLANGDYQAAIGVAQSSLPAAVRLLAELEQLNGEFDRLSVQVWETLRELRRRARELLDPAANARLVRPAGGTLEFAYDGYVDYWANGLLGRLCAALDEEQERIEAYLAGRDIENLRIAAERLPLYMSRLELCRTFADEEFLLSCGVQELAMRLHEALTEAGGWMLLRAGFQEKDPRRPYCEVFRDALGHTAAIVIQPDKRGKAVFSVDVCDGEQVQSEGMCGILRDAVLARLEACGIALSDCSRKRDFARGEAPSHFICERCADGARKKEERIKAVCSSIGLRPQGGR